MATAKEIIVVGFDPSMSNWGISRGIITIDPFNLRNSSLKIAHLAVIQPDKPDEKQVRVNSKDLIAAEQLAMGALKATEGAQAIFVEVPVGSQSARAMASYGVCIGVLGALRASGIPFFEVTPSEVKLASVGSKTASKAEMISWATQLHPEGNWPTEMRKGILRIIESKAEHMADATAAIYAGVRTTTFQQLLPLLVSQMKAA
jgi:Holliday junction resolvasome RuvABC endonuclease subunit